jgi:hypothetical protein
MAGVNGHWPLEIPLGAPSEAEAARDVSAMREWVSAWRAWSGPGEVGWIERRWRSLGTQRLPDRVVVLNATDAAACVGEAERWRTALSRYEVMVSRRPSLELKLPRYFDLLADAQAADIGRIESVLEWLGSNPTRQLYPRQLPIAGIDTKWLEAHLGIISDLWGAPVEFRRAPFTVRVRLLDPELCRAAGGLSDICAPVDQLAALNIQPATVWIVENLQTGLAFEPLPGSVIFMGLGYGVPVLSSIPWIQRAVCNYWGDIDTHGFAILSRARLAIPGLRSQLMDEATLLRYRELWVEEAVQCLQADARCLTPVEQAMFDALQQNSYGLRVRLEQERIPWDYAWSKVRLSVQSRLNAGR